MTDQQPKILPCPDPECGEEISITCGASRAYAACQVCAYYGPEAWIDVEASKEGAIAKATEAHNRIASQSAELAQVRQELKGAERERDYLVNEYERAVGCGEQGYAHAAGHVYNAIVNARCDANADRFIKLTDRIASLERKLEDEKLRECRTCATAGATVRRLQRKLAEAEERAAEARRKALLVATDLTNSRKRLVYDEEERLELAQRAWETLMTLRRELEGKEVDRALARSHGFRVADLREMAEGCGDPSLQADLLKTAEKDMASLRSALSRMVRIAEGFGLPWGRSHTTLPEETR